MLRRKLIRTLALYKAQFISLIFMITVGFGCLIGFNIEWKSIKYNFNEIAESTGYADYRLYQNSKDYFKESDITKIKTIDGIDSVTRSFSIDISKVKEKDDEKTSSINLNILETYASPSKLYIACGEEYTEESAGIYLSDKYASEHNIKVGDIVSFKINNVNVDFKVVALIKQAEYLINVSTNQLMPDYYAYGFGYITPKKALSIIDNIPYNIIYIKSDLSIKEMNSKLSSLDLTSFSLVSKENDTDYSQTLSEIEEGKTMAFILPLLFLVIALFTLIITMNRIVRNERGQIGILKSLGFKDYKIVLHYMTYGIFVTIIGILFAIGLGYLIGYMVINPKGMMSTYMDFISWTLKMPSFVYLICLIILLIIVLTCFISVKNITKENPSQTLTREKPKSVKGSILEKTKIWSHLGFGTKWNIRNFSRVRIRTVLSILSAGLSIAIIFASLSFRDTENKYIDIVKYDVIRYNTEITPNSASSKEDIIKFAKEIKADYCYHSAITLKGEDEAIALNIYNNSNDLYGFLKSDGTKEDLNKGGAYISVRLQNNGYNIGDYIEFASYGSNTYYKAIIKGIILSTSSKEIVFSEEGALEYDFLSSFTSNVTSIYSSLTKEEVQNLNSNYVTSIKDRNDILSSYDTMMSLANLMIYLLVFFACILAIFVLYNIATISYFERLNEFATLKVLGFRDAKINKILYGENFSNIFFGFIIGVPLGYLIKEMFIKLESSRYEFIDYTSFLTCFITLLLTLVTGFVVSFMLSKKNKNLDMVISLKSRE